MASGLTTLRKFSSLVWILTVVFLALPFLQQTVPDRKICNQIRATSNPARAMTPVFGLDNSVFALDTVENSAKTCSRDDRPAFPLKEPVAISEARLPDVVKRAQAVFDLEQTPCTSCIRNVVKESYTFITHPGDLYSLRTVVLLI